MVSKAPLHHLQSPDYAGSQVLSEVAMTRRPVTANRPPRGVAHARQRIATGTVVLATLVMSATGCVSNDGATPSSSPSTTLATPSPTATATAPSDAVPTTVVSVSGRATAPVETDAPGIQLVPPNVLSLEIGNEDITVEADDWNTISGSSSVPGEWNAALDPDMHATPTTRNRFQYLADLIGRHTGPDFTLYSIANIRDGRDVVSVVPIVNPGHTAVRLTRLTMTVTVSPPKVTFTKGTFYAAEGQHLVVAPHGIYFARLTTPALGDAKPTQTRSTDFSWNADTCSTSAC